jgi:transposase
MAKVQRGTESQAIGKVQGRHDDQGMSSGMDPGILVPTDAPGNLVRFVLLPGQRHDTMGVAPLIQDLEFGVLIPDEAFDTNWIIAELNERGASIVISQRPHRLKPLAIDAEKYQWRHLIEKLFCKLEEFKPAAMRADKTDQSFKAMVYLCSALISFR